MAQEMQEDVQEQEEISSDTGARVKYFLATAVPAGIGLEVLGASTIGLAIAGIAGITAAFFCPEIRDAVGSLPHLPHVDMSRWVTRRVYYDEGEQEATLEPLSDEIDNVQVETDERNDDETQTALEPLQRVTASNMTPEQFALGGKTFVEFDPETHLDFGPTLRIFADKFLSGRKVLFGVSDAGKSNNIAVIVEELARLGVPLFLMDTEGEYRSLCNKAYMPNWIYVSKHTHRVDQMYSFAQFAIEKMKQVVIDLQSYEDDEAAWIIIHVINGVRDWQEKNDKVPCEIVIDEAAVWLPQQGKQSTLNKVMIDDPEGKSIDERGEPKQVTLLSVLERTVFSILVRRGRKRGMGLTLATQRPASLNKDALSASWLFLMRQTQAADFHEYKKYGLDSGAILKLRQGEAFVFPPDKPMEIHRFRLRRSPHGATTPGMKELKAHRLRMEGVVTDMPVAESEIVEEEEDIDTILATLPDIDSKDTRYLGDEPEIVETHLPPRVRPLPDELMRVYKAYQPNLSQRQLATGLGTNQTWVKYRLDQLHAAGYIDKATRQKLVNLP